MLQSARGDLAGGECCYGDRYTDPAHDKAAALIHAGSDDRYDYWVATLPAPTRRVRYRFRLLGCTAEDLWLGENGPGQSREECAPFQYSYINPGDGFRMPAWLAGSVMYQIFPDRFARANPEPAPDPWGKEPTWYTKTGGDLRGIQDRLDWLEALGVGCIYLTPVFASPSCHRYDTTDYYRVDPLLGRNEDLASLTHAAHRRRMRLVLDGSFNHSGQEFFAFQDAVANGKASPYWHWFNIRGNQVKIGPGGRCNYETFARHLPHMPKLMTQHPDVAEYLLGVAEHWLRTAGIDGWRLDVANEIDHRFWRAFRSRVRAAQPEAFILGEVWVDALAWLQGDQFDSVMHYPWRDAVLGYLTGILTAPAFDAALTRLRFVYPGFVTGGLVHLISSHDVPRILTMMGGSREKAALAAVLLFTAQGIPMLYYGDEIGMVGGADPVNRGCMVWEEEQHDTGLLRLYRRLGQIRRTLSWLNIGAWQSLLANPATGVIAYRRSSDLALNAAPAGLPAGPAHEAIWVVINPGERAQTVSLDDLPRGVANLIDPDCPVLHSRRLRLSPGGFALLGNPAVRERLRQRS